MNENSDQQRLLNTLPELTTRFPAIEVLYLFGSRANGAAGSDSDLDVAVFLEAKALRDNPLLDLEIGAFLEKKLSCPVDVLVMQKASPITQHQVLAGGVRLFEREPAYRARVELISFKRYQDARHYQKKRQEAFRHG